MLTDIDVTPSRSSLTRSTMLKLALWVAVVIVTITSLTYLHVVDIVTKQSLDNLEKYGSERVQRDSVIFHLAEDNHKLLKQELLAQLNNDKRDPKSAFENLFKRYPDGTVRTRHRYLDGRLFDGTREGFGYIGNTANIDRELQRRVLIFLELSNRFGPAWHHHLQNVYFTAPENLLVGYWPEVSSWAHDANSELYIPNEEFAWVADIAHNPARETVWTGLFYDETGKTWMASAETPVDFEGEQIATIGHDITLNELITRTINNTLAGSYNFILRDDGRLITHPDKLELIKKQHGYYNIFDSDDEELLTIYKSIKNRELHQSLIFIPSLKLYLAVNMIPGPNWLSVIVYPEMIIKQTALSTARLILILGACALLIELLILFFVLKRNVTRPLVDLTKATKLIAAGSYNIKLDTKRKDELGEIARAFTCMIDSIQLHNKKMQDQHLLLEQRVEERTQNLSEQIEERQRIEAVVSAKQRYLSAVLETMADGIITIETNGIIDSVNRSAEQIFGYTSDELKGKNVRILMNSRDSNNHDLYIKRYAASGSSRFINKGRRLTGRHKDGSEIHVEIAINDTEIDGRQIVVGAIRDISHQVYIEQELLKAKSAAEKANLAKSQFLSNMSHELRTPLNAILGFSQLLLLGNSLGDEEKKNIEEIFHGGNHLLELINEVLDLSKIEIEKMELNLSRINLHSAISSAVDLTMPIALERSISIVIEEIKCEYIEIYADPKRLKQVLINLLSNAVKYNKDHGQIKITIDDSGTKTIGVTITDSGQGIPEKELNNIFMPFSRLKTQGQTIEGTGIGLTITKRLIELMGGNITVISRIDEGSSFRFEIPRADTDQKNSIDEFANPPEKKTRSTQATLLYIEDNYANLRLVQQIVTRLKNVRIIDADSGEKGLLFALSYRPDIILLDINLPFMNGYEVLNRIRGDSTTKDIPVIALSASASPEDIEKGLNAGFYDHITKPINPIHLQNVIEELLKLGRNTIVG